MSYRPANNPNRQFMDDVRNACGLPYAGAAPFFNAVGIPIRRPRWGGRPHGAWSLALLEQAGQPDGFCRFRPSIHGDRTIEVGGVVYKRTPRRVGDYRVFVARA